ncbi:HAMP domain-containing sensor histidine kinase [Paenibacillus lautus]|uniref:sensor histidine kinase n=1 Tax=Paenibacillus lautus TaxID=1401 RepID=UPI003D276EAB
MNIYLRLGVHIVGSLFVRILVILTVSGIACIFTAKSTPMFPGITVEQWKTVVFLVFLFGSLLLCFLYCIWYLGKPLVYLMKWITLLAGDKYEAPPLKRSFYKGNGKLKNPYHLYEGLIMHMRKLTANLQNNAMERDRMDELKREWGAGISHDLKTPLTYIKSYASMLLSPQYGWNDSEKTKFLWEIQQKTEHLEELIQDLNLSFQMDHQNIPLSATSGDIVDFVRRIAADVGNDPRASKHELNCDALEERIDASYDPKLFERALYNLLMNAVLHNPPGTTISISVYRDERIHIVIKDDGVGMSEETMRYLFHRYYRGSTTKQKSEGTGLGMAIAKQLVLAHQGDISVTSRTNEGTAVEISLPSLSTGK